MFAWHNSTEYGHIEVLAALRRQPVGLVEVDNRSEISGSTSAEYTTKKDGVTYCRDYVRGQSHWLRIDGNWESRRSQTLPAGM